jgi:[ribosomal protein S5]-alanine N-acetyltransferase
MRKCIDMGEGREIIINDKDMLKPDGILDIPDIGLGEAYRGKASYVVYDEEDIDDDLLELVCARKYNEPLVISETGKFIIREMTVEDLPHLYELYQTLSDCPYVEPLYEYEDEKAFTIKYIENMYGFFGYGLWLVLDKKTGELVARAGIENRSIDGQNCQELGYLVKKSWQGKHVAWEVMNHIVDIAKDRFGLEELYICTEKTNNPSIQLALKLGFTLYAGDTDGMNIYRKKL